MEQKLTHYVIRCSNSPITNLHLGNQRGDFELFHKHINDEKWKEIKDFIENASQKCFTDSLYIGWDVLLDKKEKYIFLFLFSNQNSIHN